MNRIKKLGLGLFTLSLLFSLLSLVAPNKTYAQAGAGAWVDAGHITSGGVTYIDVNPFDDTWSYRASGIQGGCTSVIEGFDSGGGRNPFSQDGFLSSATITIAVQDVVNDRCDRTSQTIQLSSANPNQKIGFNWVDGGTIQSPIDGSSYVQDATNTSLFIAETEGNCRSTVTVVGNTSAIFIGRTNALGDCQELGRYDANIGQPANRALAAGSGTPTGGPDDAAAVDDNSCESKSGVMGWILCPVITALDGLFNWIDTQIQALLEIDESRYTDENLKRAWSNIRNIAYLILIPIMLVMVIGTALGFEIFSAYTIKRALPRMVIAVIFITLSWYIVTFLIGLSNVVGTGTLGIITAPFRSIQPAACQDGPLTLSCLFSAPGYSDGVGGGDILQSILLLPQAAAGIIGLVVFLILYGGMLIIAIGAGFLVLLARQLFLLALILVAPLAILAWIFPGNDGLWKAWWSVLSKLLLMFPLIMLLIGVGRIFALIINEAGGGGLEGTLLNPILKLGAYILPYAAIPLTFKFAGGLFGNLAGVVNNKEKGLFDRYRNLRNAGLKKGNESLMDSKGRFGSNDSKVGNSYRRAASFGRRGSLSPFAGGKARWQDYNELHRDKTADGMIEEGGQRGFNDDDASDLAARGYGRNEFIERYQFQQDRDGNYATDASGNRVRRHSLQEAQAALARTEQAVGARVGSSSMTVAAQKFRTSMTNTAYEAGPEGLEALQRDLVRLQGQGLVTAVDAAGWMKANRGRADYSANSFGDTVAFAAGQRQDGTAYTADMQLAGAFKGADPREVVGGHQRALESFSIQAQRNLDSALQSGSQAETDKALADVANVYDMLSNVSPKKGNEFADRVMSQGVIQVPVWDSSGERIDASGNRVEIIDASGNRVANTAAGPPAYRKVNTTVREIMNEAKNRPAGPNGQQTFLDRRREFSQAERQQREAQGAPEES